MRIKELLKWAAEELKLYLRVKMKTEWGKGYAAGKRDVYREIIRKSK